ncbi:hypothetical protein PWEIH_06221 [Listeria weihenstephanensis FSL R9-0317]|uniref:Uncharacterized protein n=1 Tax=Listeria weihenstephanensis TaxID=1006155 RepID=A0A1S7FRE6_9LIST|nr:hypothetical protein [Listeria weihenstephanensis]AQY49983.1 hypothetical protein UE46_02255 [Listeria weihenstephanensis]EUJ39664.1 hypothetical protein PWEIH_06221 [Listeria weihenstephanensis FSL R9-0317]
MPEKIKIDPEKFAYAVLKSHRVEGDDKEKIAKECLSLYLQSYLLVNQFNQLEASQFKLNNDSDFKKMMLAINKNVNGFY